MSGILIWSSRFSRGQKKFRSTQHSGLGGLPAALLFPWCGPLSIFIIDLNEDKEGLLSNLDLTPSSGRSLVHRMTESGFKIILTGWNSALSLRRWHLIKINVIPCVGSESIWFKSVRERQGWTATWDKMLEVFSSTLRLMLAGKVMESLLKTAMDHRCIHQGMISTVKKTPHHIWNPTARSYVQKEVGKSRYA